MKEIIKNYFYLIVVILIAIPVSIPYWRAFKLSREKQNNQPFSKSVLVTSAIGLILGFILGIIVLKYTDAGWDVLFTPIIISLFALGTILGVFVAFRAGYFRETMKSRIFESASPEALVLPVNESWALTALAFIWGTIAGLLGSLILIIII